jgi:hypothetical protein
MEEATLNIIRGVNAHYWCKGYDACRQLMTARDDRIRIDLSIVDFRGGTCSNHAKCICGKHDYSGSRMEWWCVHNVYLSKQRWSE